MTETLWENYVYFPKVDMLGFVLPLSRMIKLLGKGLIKDRYTKNEPGLQGRVFFLY